MCKSCKELRDYFENEFKLVHSEKEVLVEEVGENVYKGLLASIKAYKSTVFRITSRCNDECEGF